MNPDNLELQVMEACVRVGDTVVDVGASTGIFTFPLANMVGLTGEVYAIEPDPERSAEIRKRKHEEKLSQIKLFECAVSDKTKMDVTLYKRVEGFAYDNALCDFETGFRPRIRIMQNTLDEIIDHSPHFIKIDVEGAEGLVLAGASKCLTTCRAVLLEFAPQAQLKYKDSPSSLTILNRLRDYFELLILGKDSGMLEYMPSFLDADFIRASSQKYGHFEMVLAVRKEWIPELLKKSQLHLTFPKYHLW